MNISNSQFTIPSSRFFNSLALQLGDLMKLKKKNLNSIWNRTPSDDKVDTPPDCKE